MTHSKLIGTFVSFALTTTLALAAAAPAAAEQTQARAQQPVCRDIDMPGSRIDKRVCGTPADVDAYYRQDFESRAMNTLTGGSGWCWRINGGRLAEKCAAKSPTLPAQR